MREITPRQLKLEQKIDLLRDIYDDSTSELTAEQRLEVNNDLRMVMMEYQRRYGTTYLRKEYRK